MMVQKQFLSYISHMSIIISLLWLLYRLTGLTADIYHINVCNMWCVVERSNTGGNKGPLMNCNSSLTQNNKEHKSSITENIAVTKS